MASRTLELTLISATDLNDVNVFSKMDVYAVASIAGDQRSRQRTAVDKGSGTNPSWNATLRFAVPAVNDGLVLHVLLRSERALGDRDVGEVHIPLKELLDATAAGGGDKSGHLVSYQVRQPSSGNPKGVLNLSYKFDDAPAAPPVFPYSFPANENKSSDLPTAYPAVPPYPPPGAYPPSVLYPHPAAAESENGDPAGPSSGHPPSAKQGKESNVGEPVTAYPAVAPAYPAPWVYPSPPAGCPPSQAPYGYPPLPVGYWYGALPPAGYGYGAPPAVQKPKKEKGKMGLGMGLLGGAVGGLLIGDMMVDAMEASLFDGIDF